MEGPVSTATVESLKARVGTELGVSEWVRIDQAMIDNFANLTFDTYFIHVDPARAEGTRFGHTIAHGFLTLSLLSNMAYEVCPAVEGSHTSVNYGFNRLRFVAPVREGARVRGRFVLKAFEVGASRWQATYDVTIEIENESRPAISAEWLTAGFF
ncbi:MAG: MaoC family dehydratase [Betaproteobacteria bacterium]|nr:MaoC family dehydratase [Betaproteobacteria bacterium]